MIVETIADRDPMQTVEFPSYATFPFEEFNPVQSAVAQIHDKDCNALIAARTGAGKTVCAEQFMAYETRVRGGKAMYLAPLKALAKEKIDDWSDPKHQFGDLNMSICTGDYRLTPARRAELEASNIVVMTSEMLASRCRNYKSENNEWLTQIGTIVVDESHMLTVAGRGDHLEVGLMKLAKIAPQIRVVFLSATMPNVREIAEWIGEKLTHKTTYLLESNYRPCPLTIHYPTYTPVSRSYEDTEQRKVQAALEIIEQNLDDKFLVFVHTKRTGEMMRRALDKAQIKCEVHNADLDKEKRHEVEHAFRNRKLHVLIATSTVAYGLNLPARRVIILGVHRGMSDVDTYDIWQMAGRAGRPGYDPRGDVYILLPDNAADRHIERLQAHQEIKSRLLDSIGEGEKQRYKTLAFHVVSEIHHGNIKTSNDLHQWYSRSLADYQMHDLDDGIIDSTIDLLVNCRAVRVIDGEYKATMTGKIASMFYFSPFDVSDLKRNFRNLFDRGVQDDDICVSMALGNIDSLCMGIVSNADRDDMISYKNKVRQKYGDQVTEAAIKGGFAYYCLMTGTNPGAVTGLARNLQFDYPRLTQVLHAIDTMTAKWNREDFFKMLKLRIIYGVEAKLVPLCQIAQVGKVRAERLYAAGLRTPEDVANNPQRVYRALNMSEARCETIIEDAQALEFGASIGVGR